jgi:transposase
MTVDACRFESARHFAAWLGLTPRERSTGGRERLGGISRAGDERLRRRLVVGAVAVIRHAEPTDGIPRPVRRLPGAASVFGARSAEPVWASGHRPRQRPDT